MEEHGGVVQQCTCRLFFFYIYLSLKEKLYMTIIQTPSTNFPNAPLAAASSSSRCFSRTDQVGGLVGGENEARAAARFPRSACSSLADSEQPSLQHVSLRVNRHERTERHVAPSSLSAQQLRAERAPRSSPSSEHSNATAAAK